MLCAYLFILGVGDQEQSERMSHADKLAARNRGDTTSPFSSASPTTSTEGLVDNELECDGRSPSTPQLPPLARSRAWGPRLKRGKSTLHIGGPEESQLGQPDPGVSAPTSSTISGQLEESQLSQPDPGVSAPTSSTISGEVPPLARPKKKSVSGFKLRELKNDDSMLKIFKRFCGKLRKDIIYRPLYGTQMGP
jgi:hypothetical protein